MAEEKTMARRPAGEATVRREKVWPFRIEKEEEGTGNAVAFPADICETGDAFLLVGEMPGVAIKDVNIHLTENELTIAGTCRISLDHEEDVILREVPGADYRRTFTLSDAVDRDKITAELKDGLLTVRLAKSERLRPRDIQITG